MVLYHKITVVSRMNFENWAIWGWIFEPLCGKIVVEVFVCRADSSPEMERRLACKGRCEMRREWLMVLLVVALLVPVGCGTTVKAEGQSSPSESADTSGTYTVRSGDTLMEISRRLFDGDAQYWDEIAELNGIKAPYTIYPGRELKVPKKGTEATSVSVGSQTLTTSKTYTVQSGDCLMDIARKHLGDPHRWREIANLNGIGSPYTIYPGDELKLPE
jgi:LysM repeat protein